MPTPSPIPSPEQVARDRVAEFTTSQLRAIVRSTKPNGAFAAQVAAARKELTRRGARA